MSEEQESGTDHYDAVLRALEPRTLVAVNWSTPSGVETDEMEVKYSSDEETRVRCRVAPEEWMQIHRDRRGELVVSEVRDDIGSDHYCDVITVEILGIGSSDDGLRADGGTKYGDKLPEGGTADLYADDEGNGAAWREETSARSIEIDVQLHEEGYQNDRKWTVHCSDLGDDAVIAGYGVEHQNKGNYWRRGDRWDDAADFADLPFPVRRRVAAVLNRPLDEITPEHRRVHREDGMGMADQDGDRDV